MINTRVGPWLIEKELARGEIGTVYLAHRPAGSPAQVALKILHAEAGPAQRLRLLREAAVLADLDHPHIVRMVERGDFGGRLYHGTEYVDASDLLKVVQRQGRVPWHQAVEVMQQAAAALKYCHDRGVVHGNVKLSHLLCATDGSKPLVKLIDFGQAWVFGGKEPAPPRSDAGNPGELSPEQRDGKPATPRSDVFGLGAVLWSLVTGKVFAGFVDPLADKPYARLPNARSLSTSIPEALDRLIQEALSSDPAPRPADAGVFLRRLDSVARAGDRRSAAKAAPGETPAEVMSRLMRAELEGQRTAATWQRVLSKPVILMVLFLITLSLIVWDLMPPGAEALYSKGAELMKSDNPRDWETAWTDYLEPLEQKYPDHAHQEEVREYKRKLKDYHDRKDAVRLAAQAGPMSEAQWFYLLGLRYRQRGMEKEAQETWQLLIDLYSHVPLEEPWVDKARLDRGDVNSRKLTEEQRWAPVKVAVLKVHELERDGKHDEARKLRASLRKMYAGSPTPDEVRILRDAGIRPTPNPFASIQ